MQLDGLQKEFSAALLLPDAPVPEGIVDPAGKPAPKRFAVYRNNVTISLIEALAAVYPAVQMLVGEDFFREMARIYVRAEPPRNPLLAAYGRGFAAFIDRFAPASRLPFLADVARLERAWLDAYHAADDACLTGERLAGFDEAALMDLVFVPHPAMRLVPSRFAVADLWRAGKGEIAIGSIEPMRAQHALVVRPDVEVAVFGLTPGEGLFFDALARGQTLAEAGDAAFASDETFNLAGALGLLVRSGAFIDGRTSND